MVLKKSIFDSKSEMNVYRDLISKWNGEVSLHDHIPVSTIIDISNLQGFNDVEKNYLWKTSFDFVVVSTKEENYGEPLLIIEFDGLGQGYTNDYEYIQTKEFEDEKNSRKWKMNTKLKACKQADIPLIIVGDYEVNSFDGNFTILDGIIGDVLANKEFKERFHNEINELEERIKNIDDPDEIQSIVDDYGITREIESKMKYNPIYNEATKLQAKLIEKNIS